MYMDMAHFCQPCDHQNYLLFCSLQWRELRVPAHLGPTGLRDTPSKTGMLSILITCILGKRLLHSVSQLDIEVCLLHLFTPVFPPQLWFGPYRHWWDDKERGTAIPAGRTSEDHHGKGIRYALLPSLTSHSHVILATWLVFEIACSACASTPLITEHSKAATCMYL